MKIREGRIELTNKKEKENWWKNLKVGDELKLCSLKHSITVKVIKKEIK